jgi:hypothetical protein
MRVFFDCNQQLTFDIRLLSTDIELKTSTKNKKRHELVKLFTAGQFVPHHFCGVLLAFATQRDLS